MTPKRMRAAVLHGREDVRIEEVEVPLLGPGDVLVRTRVALTCGTDYKVFRRGYHARMITPPALFGHEMAGLIEEVGEGVEGWVAGTPVVAANSAPCGRCEFCQQGRPSLCDDLLFWNGAYAEFVRIPARIVAANLCPVPPGLALRKAALTEPLACVLRGIDSVRLRSGQWVAILGAGPIGLMLLSLARLRGAHVVVADRLPHRLQRAREMGAEFVIAVKEDMDLAQILRQISPQGRGFEVVFEAIGLPVTADTALKLVRKGGTVNLFGGCPAGSQLGFDPARLHYEELTITSTFHHTPESVRAALSLLADGQVDANRLITADAPLERLPEILRTRADDRTDLKVAITLGA